MIASSTAASVGIVIPHFNRSALLKITLESLQQQSAGGWKAVVVDDGSDPDEWLGIQSLANDQISIFRREDGEKGPSRCRNLGWRFLKTPYIVFLDSDDLLAPWCLEERLKLADEEPNADAWVFPVMLFQQQRGDMHLLWNELHGTNDLMRFLRSDPPWHTSSTLWRRSTLQRLAGFNERVMYGDDADLHIRGLMENCVFVKTRQPMPDAFVRRAGHDRITNTLSNRLLDSRVTRLRELTLLIRSRGTEAQKLSWQGQYFVECEFLLFRVKDSKDRIASVLNAWREDWGAERSYLNQSAAYLWIAQLCRKRAYFFLRVARRVAMLLLPNDYFPIGTFERISLAPAQQVLFHSLLANLRPR